MLAYADGQALLDPGEVRARTGLRASIIRRIGMSSVILCDGEEEYLKEGGQEEEGRNLGNGALNRVREGEEWS